MNKEEKILKALELMIDHFNEMASIYLDQENDEMYDLYSERRFTLINFRKIATNDVLLDDYIGE